MRQHFACGNIEILPGEAPMVITERADAIFMGGSGGRLDELIDWSWQQLYPGGRSGALIVSHRAVQLISCAGLFKRRSDTALPASLDRHLQRELDKVNAGQAKGGAA